MQQNEQSSGSSPTTVSAGRPRSAVWEYFSYNESTNKSSCQIESCKTLISGKFTTNLKLHLKKKHNEKFLKVEKVELQNRNQKEKKRYCNTTSKVRNDSRQRTLDDVMKKTAYQKDSKKYKAVTRKLAICVATTNMPNRITDNEEFRDFVQELDPRYSSIPRRGAPNKEIEVIMVEIKQKIKALLQTARKINLTADIWSKKGMSSSFLGVTAHFFNRKDHKRYTLTLSVPLFETPHTGYRILRQLNIILSEYDIGIKRIGIVLTDNGSNMIKAFNADLLHNLEEEEDEKLEQDVELIDEANGSGENFELTENSTREDIQDNAEVHEYENNEEEHDVAFNGFCQRLGCFSHTLQLVMSEFDSIHSLKKVIKKGQELVSKCNKSVRVTEKLIQLSGKKLVSNCPTRWSSSYLLIEQLIQLKPHLTDILAELE